MCILVQFIRIIQSASPVSRYERGIISAVSCILVGSLCVLVIYEMHVEHSRNPVVASLIGVQLLSSILAIVVFVSVPRRPDVFRPSGSLVDRQYTSSLWTRWSLDWGSDLLDMSATKLVSVKDLPDMDASVRAADAKVAFKSIILKPDIQMWIQVFWAYRGQFIFQWALTLFASVIDALPQLAVLRLLQYLEQRKSVDVADLEAWLWVFSLLLSTLLETLSDARIGWLMWGDLAIPIRVTLTSLLFEKMMKSKDVKEPPKAGTDEKDHPSAESAKSNVKSQKPLTNGHTINGQAQPGDQAANATKKSDDAKKDKSSETEAKQPETQKSIVNMFAVDTNLVGHAAAMSQFYFMFVSKFVVTVVFLLFLVGWRSLLAGMVATAVFYPINKYLVQRYQRFQKALMAIRDKKTALVTEALSGIRQIKFSANEEEWSNKIMKIREEELAQLWKTKVKILTDFLWCTN